MQFYGYDRCATCRKAKAWLRARGVDFEDLDITTQPPPASLLRDILESGASSLRGLFNTSGELYREMGLKDQLPTLTEDRAVALLAAQGRLCKRPIVTRGDRHTVGFDEARFQAAWG